MLSQGARLSNKAIFPKKGTKPSTGQMNNHYSCTLDKYRIANLGLKFNKIN